MELIINIDDRHKELINKDVLGNALSIVFDIVSLTNKTDGRINHITKKSFLDRIEDIENSVLDNTAR